MRHEKINMGDRKRSFYRLLPVLLFLVAVPWYSGCSTRKAPIESSTDKGADSLPVKASLSPSPSPSPSSSSSSSPAPDSLKGLLKDVPSFSIIYTANMQGNVLPSPYSGVSRTQPICHFSQVREVIQRLKSGEENPVILVDAGGSIRGYDDFCNYFEGEPMIKLMEAAGYDVVKFYHEKNRYDRYPFILSQSRQDWQSRQQGGRPVIKKKVRGKTIAFFSLILVGTDTEYEQRAFKDLLKKEGGDINVLITNDTWELPSFAEDPEFKIKLIILDRYNGLVEPDRINYYGRNNIPVAPFVDSRFRIGKIEMGSEGIKFKRVPVKSVSYSVSKEYLKILKPYLATFKEKYGDNYNAVISSAIAWGSSEMKDGPVVGKESLTADFIADVARKATGADLAIISDSAIDGELKGIISVDRISKVLLFDNEIITMELTGKEILEFLSSNAAKGKPFYNVSGIKLGINPDNNEVIASTVRVKPIDYNPSSSYKIEPSIELKLINPDKLYFTAMIDYHRGSNQAERNLLEKGKNLKRTGINLNYAVLQELVPLYRFNNYNNYSICIPVEKRLLINSSLNEKMALDIDNYSVKENILSLGAGYEEDSYDHYQFRDFCLRADQEDAGKHVFFTGRPDYNLSGCLSYYRSGASYEKSAGLFRKLYKKYPQNDRIAALAAFFQKGNDKEKNKGFPQWGTFGKDGRHNGQSNFEGPREGKVKWRFKTDQPLRSSPVITADGKVIFSGGDGFLYALNFEGVRLWKVSLSKQPPASPVISPDGVIYVGSREGSMYAIDPGGRVLWEYKAGGPIEYAAASGSDGTLYFSSGDGGFYAMDSNGSLKWKISLPDKVTTSPAIDEKGNLIVGCKDNNLYSISMGGEVNWKYQVSRKIYSTPAITNYGKLVFGSENFRVYALEVGGRLVWEYKTGYFVSGSPAVNNNGAIFFGSKDNYLYKLGPWGKIRWKFKTGYEISGSPVIDIDGKIFFGSNDSFVYCLSPEGKMLWKVRLGSGKYVESSPALSKDGSLYVGSDDGCLYCIK